MPLEKNKEKKKILVVCPHPEGIVPGQRLKYEQYFESWRSNGYEITVAPFMSLKMQNIVYKKGFLFTKVTETIKGYFKRIKLLFDLKNYDIVYYFLWVTPFGPPIFERLFCNFSKKIIYDIDDLVYSKNKTTSWYIRILKGYSKPIFLMKKAHHIITCTPYLDEFVKKYNTNTTDISSTVDTEKRYTVVNEYNNNKPIVIGWSGSHSTIKHFLTIENVLKRIQQKYPTAIVKVIGGANVLIEGVQVESCDWNEKIEISTLQSFDIGIYPLPNEEWVFGKSSLKAIQYMALGIPTVATAIGTNFRVIENEISGFLVTNEDEWVERISQLIDNPDLRKAIGQAARKKIETEFSIKANAPKYISILKNLQ
jgi:L-malate glycosyltransferase